MSEETWEQPSGRRASPSALIIVALIAVGVGLAALTSDGDGEDDRLSVDADNDADNDDDGDGTAERADGEASGPGDAEDSADDPGLPEPEALEPRDDLTLPGGTSLELFAFGGGQAARIDLDTGERQRVQRRGLPDGPQMFVIGDVVVGSEGADIVGMDVELEGEPYHIAEGHHVIDGADDEHVWVSGALRQQGGTVSKAKVDGSGVVARYDLPGARLLGVDPDGVVLEHHGHIIVHDPETGQGRVIARSGFAAHAEGRVLWLHCEGDLACELVTSRVSGTEAHRVPLPAGDVAAWFGSLVSPTGEHVLLPRYSSDPTDEGARVLVLDTVDGSVDEVPVGMDGVQGLAWSPDGEWLFLADPNEGIVAWPAAGGEAVLLDPDLTSVTALAVR